jgi:hypothetical protein
MIIKGGSRSGPKWLGRHLTRVDTNERVHVMELQSPHSDLTEAFRDWQVIAEGTRGYKGLYHANIDPAIDYTMTPEQWWRCVEVLERELGLEGQPRAVVLHEKHGREHLHVVWARADIDTMTLRSDSHNYLAHERASLALEQEFGHEHVPGKHAKRDRDRQQDMPGAEITHAEWQQAERSGTDPRARKQEITQLYEASDNGTAFKAALEDAGYVLAKGERRDFVLVDVAGSVHSLSRQIKGVRAADLRSFMEDITREDLPTVETARKMQAERTEREQEQPGPDDSGTVATEHRDKALIRQADELANLAIRHDSDLSALQSRQQQEAEQERDALAKQLARHMIEAKPENLEGFEKLWRDLREAVVPGAKEARLDAERLEQTEMEADRQRQVQAMIDQLVSKHRAEMESLISEQAEERAEMLRLHHDELARLSGEAERLRIIEAEYEARKREIESRNRDGPEPFDRAR